MDREAGYFAAGAIAGKGNYNGTGGEERTCNLVAEELLLVEVGVDKPFLVKVPGGSAPSQQLSTPRTQPVLVAFTQEEKH
jgi:hypothetical protein